MSEGITTYSVTYCDKPRQPCGECQKVIPLRSLSAAEIYRKSKSEKKKSAKHTWYHFKCWTVPELVTKLPIEQLRGYPALLEKDQRRVKKVVDQGVGASWADMSSAEQAEQPKKAAKAQMKKVEEDNEEEKAEEEMKPKKKLATTDKKEKTTVNPSKKKKKDAKIDLTAGLTGVQSGPGKKVTQLGKRKATEPTAENKIPEVKLDKEDQMELESITREIQNALKKAKKSNK